MRWVKKICKVLGEHALFCEEIRRKQIPPLPPIPPCPPPKPERPK